MEELEIIDEQENVKCTAQKEVVHTKGLLHKSIHILIFDNDRKIYCRYRNPQKSVNPGWTASVGAHVLPGEDYDTTAKRALKSMLRLSCALYKIGKIRVRTSSENEISETYLGHIRTHSEICDPTAEDSKFFTIEEIRELALQKKTTPHLIQSVEIYMGSRDGRSP